MTHPLIINRYNATVEIWDTERSHYVTLTYDIVREMERVIASSFDVAGIVYRNEPPPPPTPKLCKHNISVDDICDECSKEIGLIRCEQCDEIAWDGYICHACGMKDI